jgi:O-antigen/teichoic acid export membrane protein
MTVGRLPTSNIAARWGLVDQALFASSNFLLGITVAHTSKPKEFGAFSLVYVVFMFATGVARALAYEPLTVRFGGAPRDDLEAASDRSLAATMLFSLAVGALLIAASVVCGPVFRPYLLVLGLSIAALLVEDTFRGVCFAAGRPAVACACDAAWLVLQIVGFAVLFATRGHIAPWTLFAVWTGSCFLALIGTLIWAQIWPLPVRTTWFAEHRRLIMAAFSNYALTSLPPYLVYAVLPAGASLGALGKLRAVYLLFGPLGVLNEGLLLGTLPVAVRRGPGTVMRRLGIALSAASTLMAIVWSAAMLFLPNAIGQRLLGDNWAGTTSVRIALGVSLAAEACMIGAALILRAHGAQRRLASRRLLAAPVTICLSLILGHIYGAAGAAAGFAIGYWTASLTAWIAAARIRPAMPHPIAPALAVAYVD